MCFAISLWEKFICNLYFASKIETKEKLLCPCLFFQKPNLCARLLISVSSRGLPTFPCILSSTLKVKHKRTGDTESLALSDFWTTRNTAFWFPNKTLKSTYSCCTDSYISEQFTFFSPPWMHSNPFLCFLVTGCIHSITLPACAGNNH